MSQLTLYRCSSKRRSQHVMLMKIIVNVRFASGLHPRIPSLSPAWLSLGWITAEISRFPRNPPVRPLVVFRRELLNLLTNLLLNFKELPEKLVSMSITTNWSLGRFETAVQWHLHNGSCVPADRQHYCGNCLCHLGTSLRSTHIIQTASPPPVCVTWELAFWNTISVLLSEASAHLDTIRTRDSGGRPIHTTFLNHFTIILI